jgi:hypothetical protein
MANSPARAPAGPDELGALPATTTLTLRHLRPVRLKGWRERAQMRRAA